MFDSVGNAICTVVLGVVLVYLIIWTGKFVSYCLDKQRAKNRVVIQEKQKSIRQRTIACAKNYWYNIREVEDCPKDKKVERLYHYFETEQECIKALIIEMYDCALVRTEELERIAYGEVRPVKIIVNPYEIDDEYDDFDYDFDEAVEELMLQDDDEIAASAEEADDAEVRAEIYDRWTEYVMQLYDRICINCNEEMKAHIRSKIMSYGHKEVEILIHSPE